MSSIDGLPVPKAQNEARNFRQVTIRPAVACNHGGIGGSLPTIWPA
jgi:hypothetical protein